MTLSREHALELLALLAVIALVQWPPSDEIARFDANPTKISVKTTSAPVLEPIADQEPRHRIDPVALLQASVPRDWRVQLPPYTHTSNPELRC
jgi:hypothetical protein